MRLTDVAMVSRRRILAGMVVGCGALVSACGGPSAAPVGLPSDGGGGQVPASGGGQVPASGGGQLSVPIRSTSSDPLAAVVVPNTPSPTTQAEVPPTATVVPTDTAQPTPIPTDAPTETPVPTPTPIPYVAARLTDVLGESVTSYAGSIASRVANVQLATRLINGATIAPGAVFSFDDRVGDQTQAHGFQVAYGIVNGKDGVPETVKADAGGICQVATTLFQSVYWAGLPIVRRYHHLYWIAHYGTPPYGMVGLDATVDFAPVDFQFKNTTSDWIRVEATYDSSHVRMRLFGVSQGWKVTAGTPQIFNMVKVDRTPVLKDDPTQSPGWALWVEAAEDGFDVTIERLVKSKSGDLVDRYVFTNHYEPARNVKMVGSRGLAPTATPGSVTPTAVATAATVTPSTATPPSAPLSSATATPAGARLGDGRIRVPSLFGLTEAQARQSISDLGLQNTFANYQGPSDVPSSILGQVGVGAVISQIPAPGSIVALGTTVYLAVRKS